MNRLLDMGVEDYLLTSTVIGVLAQRLVRTLCPHCKEPHAALPEIVEQMRLDRFTDDEGDHALPPDRLRAVRADRLHGTDQHHGNAAGHRSAAQPRDEARRPRPSCATRRSREGC